MWNQLNAMLPTPLRSKEFKSNPMVRREDRLKDARVNAERCTRDLKRDRSDLERKERILVRIHQPIAFQREIHSHTSTFISSLALIELMLLLYLNSTFFLDATS
jgi:hypothetical protein